MGDRGPVKADRHQRKDHMQQLITYLLAHHALPVLISHTHTLTHYCTARHMLTAVATYPHHVMVSYCYTGK